MPELPEVETVRSGLEQILDFSSACVLKIETSSKKLRSNAKPSFLRKIKGERLLSVQRRAKYLLFELENHFLLSHLGMTGSWRVGGEKKKHDHIHIFLSDKKTLIYHDPRRFGMFDILEKEKVGQDPRLSQLGLDPIDDATFTGEYLYKITKKRKVNIKTLIMNQQIVVGIGNIYASEALYLAAINPLTLCCKLSKRQVNRLVESVKEVLFDAIACGGTTISDFKQAGGSSGYFQNFLLVYGRDKESCHFCKSMIVSQAIVGRNSFWCPKCQKL